MTYKLIHVLYSMYNLLLKTSEKYVVVITVGDLKRFEVEKRVKCI